ncbi:MAG: class I SAM-dependent methyltransferase [Desulfobulbaceae bacterium]|nr:class I SAM-dependent methyltransferase [Desulfobulbaceae bacterium]
MRYSDIDWNRLWQEAFEQKSWKKKKKKDWDNRASGFAKRNIDSSYADLFLKLMEPDPSWNVLDVGCGPGTLALPLASRVKSVTAVDFSASMLAELEKRKEKENIANVIPLQASWTDDWQKRGIPVHDVALSSRSLSVFDLQAALTKLNKWATKKVFIADRVGSGPFDPDIFAALGRKFDPGPDYIVTVNLLYKMGIHPRIDYIELDQSKTFSNKEEALASCQWMFDDLSDREKANLTAYVNERLIKKENGWELTRRSPVKWAFISWEK